MKRTVGILVAGLAAVSMIGISTAGAEGGLPTHPVPEVADGPRADPELRPRVTVGSPWGKDDTTGDAARPAGDLRRIIVGNGHQRMDFTFRTVAYPKWDTPSTDRFVYMAFYLDWRNTSVAPNRSLFVDRVDGTWIATILNGRGQVVCSRTGGVRQLTNHRFSISAPVQQCLGGPQTVRVASSFWDDLDDTAEEIERGDHAPNSRFYGPFIRLPESSGGDAGAMGWTVH